MPRPLRIEYPGAIYHLMNRGDRQEAIFKDDRDRRTFLDTLGETCEKTGWQIQAFCLMGHLFSGRYKPLVIDERGEGYLRTPCDSKAIFRG